MTMTSQDPAELARALLTELTTLQARMLAEAAASVKDWTPRIHRPEFAASAANMADWLALRRAAPICRACRGLCPPLACQYWGGWMPMSALPFRLWSPPCLASQAKHRVISRPGRPSPKATPFWPPAVTNCSARKSPATRAPASWSRCLRKRAPTVAPAGSAG